MMGHVANKIVFCPVCASEREVDGEFIPRSRRVFFSIFFGVAIGFLSFFLFSFILRRSKHFSFAPSGSFL